MNCGPLSDIIECGAPKSEMYLLVIFCNSVACCIMSQMLNDWIFARVVCDELMMRCSPFNMNRSVPKVCHANFGNSLATGMSFSIGCEA